MTRLPLFLAVVLTASSTMAAASETRHADAHEHGHGQLTIAIEGSMIEMEIEIPGADIVGFEHPPETAEQHEIFDAGKAKLSKGDALFQVTSRRPVSSRGKTMIMIKRPRMQIMTANIWNSM